MVNVNCERPLRECSQYWLKLAGKVVCMFIREWFLNFQNRIVKIATTRLNRRYKIECIVSMLTKSRMYNSNFRKFPKIPGNGFGGFPISGNEKSKETGNFRTLIKRVERLIIKLFLRDFFGYFVHSGPSLQYLGILFYEIIDIKKFTRVL